MSTPEYAAPRVVANIADCHYYHTMELPGHGVVAGDWDLRADPDGYLGHHVFAGQRVLEVGPASGFCTWALEQRGASVVTLELPDEPGWDFVPYPAERLAPVLGPRRQGMTRLKNSWWFTRAALGLQARQVVAHAAAIPDNIGRFDTAVLASVLLHCRDPAAVLQACAARADTLVVTDLFHPELEGRPACEFVPTVQNFHWDLWWRFSSTYIAALLAVMGFRSAPPVISSHRHAGQDGYRVFSIVATRG